MRTPRETFKEHIPESFMSWKYIYDADADADGGDLLSSFMMKAVILEYQYICWNGRVYIIGPDAKACFPTKTTRRDLPPSETFSERYS